MRTMTLRTKLLLWFIALHLVFAGLAVVVLIENQSWLFAIELFFAVSIVISYRLVTALFVPLELIAVATGVAAFLDVVLDIDLPFIPDSRD